MNNKKRYIRDNKITIEYYDSDFDNFMIKYFNKFQKDTIYFDLKQEFKEKYNIKNTFVFLFSVSTEKYSSITLTNIIPPKTEPNLTSKESFLEIKKQIKTFKKIFIQENVKIIYSEEYAIYN